PGSNPEKCNKVRIRSDIDLMEKDGNFYLSGFVHCGQIWKCPLCARFVAFRRGKEIQTIIDRVRADRGDVYLLTCTLPHDEGDDLKPLKKAVTKAFGRMLTGPPWKRAKQKYHISGWCRTLEVTHGKNGWHPHIHSLLFTRQPLTDAQRAALQEFLYRRWADYVERSGYRRPTPEHGLTLCHGENAGNYIAKITKQGFAEELTRSDSKAGRNGSRSILQIVDDYGEYGRASDEALIREWFEAMPGSRQLTWSKGFRNRYLPPEQSDFDLAQDKDDPQAELIIRIAGAAWDRLTLQGRHWIPLLLEVAERSGRAGVTAFLNSVLEHIPP
ncbi:unnamed protein product, partial [marine sediment metagenome]